jgi:hypothetical protein
MDVAGGLLLYDGSTKRVYLTDAPNFRAARDILDQLPQRELGFEMLARQGLDACKSPGRCDLSTSQTYETFEEVQK